MFRSNVLLATLVAALTVAGTGVVLADNNEEDMDEQHELTALRLQLPHLKFLPRRSEIAKLIQVIAQK